MNRRPDIFRLVLTTCALGCLHCGGAEVETAALEEDLARTRIPGVLDDAFEQNDDLNQATDLDAQSWTTSADGLYQCTGHTGLVARSLDHDVYRVRLDQQGLITVCIETDGAIDLTMTGYEQGTTSGPAWNADGVFLSTPSAVDTCVATTGFVPAGDYFLAVWREAAGRTYYDFSVCVHEDTDDDGIMENIDNCPSVFNPDQADYNHDGVGDACDDDPYAEACTHADPGTGEGDATCRGRITLGGGQKIYYYRSHPLGDANPQIRRAVIVVHGSGRTAWSYFNRIVTPAERNGVINNTIILAPHFMNQGDNHEAADTWWTQAGWVRGDKSVTLPRISSYAVVDEMIEKLTLSGDFPALHEIVVAGHSAGGQFTQRYAAGSLTVGPDMRYVVANPSSYMYLDQNRLVGGVWQVPGVPCPYNVYKFGPVSRNAYMLQVGSRDDLRQQFIQREVIYLIGSEEDNCSCNPNTACHTIGTSACTAANCSCNHNNHPTDPWLNCAPEAQAQGINRYERAYNFLAHLDAFYPSHVHDLYEIAGVGHEGGSMFDCGAGPRALFGAWAIPGNGCP